MSVDATILSFYSTIQEENRLDFGLGQLEALRTRALFTKHAPPPPATIYDVGGAAGAYAFWLATTGYSVHLLDATPRHVEAANARQKSANAKLASIELGDARMLPFSDASADIVLLLGPLYHLTTLDDRLRAIREAARVLKPDGMLFAGAISRWASAVDGLAWDRFADPRFEAIVDRDVREGQHRNTSSALDYFTTAFFHTPEEFRDELSAGGFVVQNIYGLEGPATMLDDFDARWADPRKRADIIRVAEQTESAPSIVGISAHLLGVARRS